MQEAEAIASTAKAPLIEARNIAKAFSKDGARTEVLRGVTLSISRGEMVSVVGASGAGKSTLLHILGTLETPSSGEVWFEGKRLDNQRPKQLARFRNEQLGFVFQFHHLLPEFTAAENVMMPGMIRGQRRKQLRERAAELLDAVGLSHRSHHRPSEMSGGEQQRVALARALMLEPPLVLADEPTGNLDTATSDLVRAIFHRLNERYGTSFLIVTHSRDLAASMPRTIEMRDGLIADDRTVTSPKRAPGSLGADAPQVARVSA